MVSEETSAANVAPRPRKRALPFKRTVDSAPVTESASNDDEDALGMFSHAKELFPELVRDMEEEHREEQEKKRRKLSENRCARSHLENNHLLHFIDCGLCRERSTSPPKRTPSSRRQSTVISDSDNDTIVDVKGKGKEVVRSGRSRSPSSPVAKRSAFAAPTPKRAAPEKARRSSKALYDSDDSDGEYKPPKSSSLASKQIIADSDSSDIEIIESKPAPKMPDPDEDEPNEEPPVEEEENEWIRKARLLQEKQKSQSLNAIIWVFVTSPLPESGKPVAIKRRVTQNMQLILNAWVAKKRMDGLLIPEEVEKSLILLWKGNKVYGENTLASLGIEIDELGEIKDAHGPGYINGGVHLEVVTEDFYAEWCRANKEGQLRRPGDKALHGKVESEALIAQEPKSQKFKVVLKAKEREVKFTVAEDKTVETMIQAFLVKTGLSADEWDVSIWLDGEQLEEDTQVKDLDLDKEDINQLEVHIKERR